jgi:hypothetical protein
MKMTSEKTIQEVLETHEDFLMSLPSVNGVGIGLQNDLPVILVFLSSKSPNADIPASLEGFPVQVMESGTFTAGG